ncbi:MAG: sodium:proton antiporter [Candidatus Promineifilaceae bacterium]|nr:sodium:proton antiporter [Candidatus Promineifilaceae bacterium]
MQQTVIIGLAIIVVLGIAAQWLAWRFKLPAILLLLIFGFIAGPVTGLIVPDQLFGELLFPFVSVSVAIILFEGGLTLRLNELRGVQGVVRLLISLGALVTWAVVALASYYILGLGLELAVLLGAVLVVTGPTVVIPLLRQVRPARQISSVLKWEGILIDPIGATLAVLVFEGIIDSGPEHQLTVFSILFGIVVTLLVGTVVGAAFAYILIQFLKRDWIATFLETAVALMAVLAAFALSNELRTESGLMAVTVMGIILANQKQANISHITSFKEELGVLLLSSLFIVLAARVNLPALLEVVWQEVAFLLVIILVARPLAVFVSTLFSKMPFKEKLFLSAMAPRGIVAVAVASLFAIELEEAGFAGAEQLINFTILAVVGTVIIYSLLAKPLATRLDIVQKQPQGTLLVGAHHWARQIAAALQDVGFDVWLVDTNGRHIKNATAMGLSGFHESIMSDGILDDLPTESIGRLLALTDNNELNALAAVRFAQWLGEDHVFQIASTSKGSHQPLSSELRGTILFGEDMTFKEMERGYFSGYQVVVVKENTADALIKMKEQGIECHVLFVITEDHHLLVSTCDDQLMPREDQAAICWVSAAVKQEIGSETDGRVPVSFV